MTTTAESHEWIALKSVAGQLLLEGEKKTLLSYIWGNGDTDR